MELKGKKIYFLGDSITEGVGASDAEHCYVSVFGKLSGAIVKNYGISATRIAWDAEQNFYDQFSERLKKAQKELA